MTDQTNERLAKVETRIERAESDIRANVACIQKTKEKLASETASNAVLATNVSNLERKMDGLIETQEKDHQELKEDNKKSRNTIIGFMSSIIVGLIVIGVEIAAK